MNLLEKRLAICAVEIHVGGASLETLDWLSDESIEFFFSRIDTLMPESIFDYIIISNESLNKFQQ